MSSFGAVLDTCVLIPARIRDTLLLSAEVGLYRASWSPHIIEELHRNLVEHNLCSEEKAERLIGQMCEFFPEAMAEGYETLIPSMPVNPKDRHVLAAAVASHSEIIVTENLRDFPESLLQPFGVEAQSTDEFLTNLAGLDSNTMIEVLHRQARQLSKPPLDFNWLLGRFLDDCPNFYLAINSCLRIR